MAAVGSKPFHGEHQSVLEIRNRNSIAMVSGTEKQHGVRSLGLCPDDTQAKLDGGESIEIAYICHSRHQYSQSHKPRMRPSML